MDRQREENWEIRDGLMWPYPDEYYLLQRKEIYEQDKRVDKYTLESWEHDGFGYIVLQPQSPGKWLLVRTDLKYYHAVVHSFRSREHLDEDVKRNGWRPLEQLSLGI